MTYYYLQRGICFRVIFQKMNSACSSVNYVCVPNLRRFCTDRSVWQFQFLKNHINMLIVYIQHLKVYTILLWELFYLTNIPFLLCNIFFFLSKLQSWESTTTFTLSRKPWSNERLEETCSSTSHIDKNANGKKMALMPKKFSTFLLFLQTQ